MGRSREGAVAAHRPGSRSAGDVVGGRGARRARARWITSRLVCSRRRGLIVLARRERSRERADAR